jgi:hypothetical protein
VLVIVALGGYLYEEPGWSEVSRRCAVLMTAEAERLAT